MAAHAIGGARNGHGGTGMSTITGLSGSTNLVLPEDNTPLPLNTPETGTTPVSTPTPTPTPPPPLFSQSFSGSGTALLLGLATPRGNFGDSEALFAQIAAALKAVEAEAKDNDEFARSSERLGLSQRTATALQQMVNLNIQTVGHEINILEKGLRIEAIDEELVPLKAQKAELEGEIERLNGVISTYQGQIDGLTTQINALGGQIDGLTGQINTLNGQIGTLEGQINTLTGQINTLNGQIETQTTTVNSLAQQLQTAQTNYANATTPADRNYWQGQINTLTPQLGSAQQTLTSLTQTRDARVDERTTKQGELNQVTSSRDGLVSTRTGLQNERDDKINERSQKQQQLDAARGQLQTAQTELNAVNGEINALEDEKAAAQDSINASSTAIVGLIEQMIAVVLGGLLFTQAMQGLLSGEASRDSFDTREFTDKFEDALGQILAEVTKLVQEKADGEYVQENAQIGLGDWRFEQGDRIAVRFGALQPAQTMALGFASALSSIVGTLRTLMEQADSMPQTAATMAQSGVERMRMSL